MTHSDAVLGIPDAALLVDAVGNMNGLTTLHISINLQTYIHMCIGGVRVILSVGKGRREKRWSNLMTIG